MVRVKLIILIIVLLVAFLIYKLRLAHTGMVSLKDVKRRYVLGKVVIKKGEVTNFTYIR